MAVLFRQSGFRRRPDPAPQAGALGNSRPVEFAASWKPLAIYLATVIWTPIFSMPPLPPFRLDDIWIIAWVFLRIFSRGGISAPTRETRVIFFAIAGLAAATAVSLAINIVMRVKSGYRFSIGELFTVGIYLRMLVVFWLVSGTRWTPAYIRNICIAFVAVMTASSAVSFAQHFGIAPLDQRSFAFWTDNSEIYVRGFYTGEQYRTIGTIGNPNFLGEFFCINLACGLYLLSTTEWRRKWPVAILGLVAMLVSLYGIAFVSSSRGALICGFVVLAYLIAGFPLIGVRTRVAVIALLVVSLPVGYYLVKSDSVVLPARVQMLFTAQSTADVKADDELLGLRIDMWNYRTSFLRNDPVAFIFGIGVANNDLLISDNGYLRLWLQSGILGIGFGVIFWAYVLVIVHGCIVRRGLPVEIRAEFLLFAAVFANFVIFECVADGLVHPKLGCVVAVFACLVVKLRHATHPAGRVRLPT